jgi:RNA polymerase sigma-70 factor, ECF subfamily
MLRVMRCDIVSGLQIGHRFTKVPIALRHASLVMGTTDHSLLIRVRDGSEGSWQRLDRIYRPCVKQWCSDRGVDKEQAEDICQEVFISVHRRIAAFRSDRPGDSFRGWLWTITTNALRDHFRSLRKHPPSVGGTRIHEEPDWGSGESASNSLEDDSTDTDRLVLRHFLAEIRAEYSEQAWRAFWRTTVDEVSSRDVAAELGITANAVRQSKARILKRLRDEMDGLENPERLFGQ